MFLLEDVMNGFHHHFSPGCIGVNLVGKHFRFTGECPIKVHNGQIGVFCNLANNRNDRFSDVFSLSLVHGRRQTEGDGRLAGQFLKMSDHRPEILFIFITCLTPVLRFGVIGSQLDDDDIRSKFGGFFRKLLASSKACLPS